MEKLEIRPGRKVCEAMRGLAHSTRRRVIMYQMGEDEKQLLYSTSFSGS